MSQPATVPRGEDFGGGGGRCAFGGGPGGRHPFGGGQWQPNKPVQAERPSWVFGGAGVELGLDPVVRLVVSRGVVAGGREPLCRGSASGHRSACAGLTGDVRLLGDAKLEK